MEIVKLKDICIGNGSYGIGASAVDKNDTLPTYLRITDIKDDGTIDLNSLKSVDDCKSEEYVLEKNDIVFARTGNSTGKSYFYNEKDGKLVYAGFLIKFSLDPQKVNPAIMKFYTHSKPYYDWVHSFDTGATRGNINAKTFGDMEITLPEREQQDRIVSILSSLDAKIETNNRLSEKLEELAQTIFKSWFVDFEPFKKQKFHETELGMIPEGWEVKTVDEFCRIFTGKKNANQSDANGIYPFFSCAPDPLRSNDYLYDGYAVIIAGNGSYTGRTQLYNGKFDLYQRTYACVAKEKFFNDKIVFIYLMMKHGFEREKMGGTRGSSIPYIVMNDIAKQTFCYNKNVIGNFCNIVRPVMDIKHKLQIESARLASLRDTLLPRLMSGEIKL